MKGNKKNKPNTPGGFSLAWNINLFRFWLALGSPKLAKRYFDRIPLPNEDLAEKDFFLYERSIWSPYLAPDGSLRPIAWGKMLLSVLVFGAGISLLTIFLTAYTNQSATIRTQAAVIKDQETQLASKTRTHNSSKPPQDKSAASTEQVIPTPADTSIPADTSTPPGTSTPQETLQSPPEGCWQVMMTNGKSALLDTRKTPGLSQEQLYFSILDAQNNTNNLHSQSKFKNSAITLDKDRQAVEFITTDKKKLYYTYSTQAAQAGEWMEENQFNQWSKPPTPQPPEEPAIVIKLKRSLKLRMQPNKDSDVVTSVPEGKTVTFRRYAPIAAIASKKLWIEVDYKTQGATFKGWLPAFSCNTWFVKPDKTPETVILTPRRYVTFRTSPLIKDDVSNKHTGVPNSRITRGKIVTVIGFVPFTSMLDLKELSDDHIMIRINYDNGSGTPLTGWIAAAKVSQKNIVKIDKPANKAN